jgi:hypothetical protein
MLLTIFIEDAMQSHLAVCQLTFINAARDDSLKPSVGCSSMGLRMFQVGKQGKAAKMRTF